MNFELAKLIQSYKQEAESCEDEAIMSEQLLPYLSGDERRRCEDEVATNRAGANKWRLLAERIEREAEGSNST
jgi:hypothetical protein